MVQDSLGLDYSSEAGNLLVKVWVGAVFGEDVFEAFACHRLLALGGRSPNARPEWESDSGPKQEGHTDAVASLSGSGCEDDRRTIEPAMPCHGGHCAEDGQ